MPNTHIFKSHNYENQYLSGYVILMMATLRNNTREYLWNDEIHKIVSSCKKNSINTESHNHGLEGFAYSFGNKANYGNINGSSVSIYLYKSSKNSNLNRQKNENATLVENLCKDCLENRMNKILTYIPEISLLISPIINSAYCKQVKEDIKLLHNNQASILGCWNTILYIDGSTNQYHCEK